MLKISVEESDNSVRLILEGRLVGPWVEELQRVCQTQYADDPNSHLIVDLCDVTSMDTHGEELLQQLYRRGAALTCSGVLNQYLVELMSHQKRKTEGACRPCHSGEVRVTSANGRK
jgi:hypothetical protein